MKLLYDVLQYDPPDIKRAVLFATNNALVCETPEDAMKVAYEMEDGHRYDVSRQMSNKNSFCLMTVINIYCLFFLVHM